MCVLSAHGLKSGGVAERTEFGIEFVFGMFEINIDDNSVVFLALLWSYVEARKGRYNAVSLDTVLPARCTGL